MKLTLTFGYSYLSRRWNSGLHCVAEKLKINFINEKNRASEFNCYPVYNSRRKRRASKKKSATLTRADVNLIVNRKFAQTLEKKFFDATFAFSAGTAAGQFPSSDGWIEDLSDMTQGVGITQRVGDRIAPTSLEFRWLIFTPNAAGLITGLFFRMVIFIWTADGTPTIGDILTSGTTPFENLISPFTHNTKENRKILFDQTILLFDSFSSAVRTTNNNSTGKVVIPLGKFQNKWGPVRYDAAGTTGQRKIWWLGL